MNPVASHVSAPTGVVPSTTYSAVHIVAYCVPPALSTVDGNRRRLGPDVSTAVADGVAVANSVIVGAVIISLASKYSRTVSPTVASFESYVLSLVKSINCSTGAVPSMRQASLSGPKNCVTTSTPVLVPVSVISAQMLRATSPSQASDGMVAVALQLVEPPRSVGVTVTPEILTQPDGIVTATLVEKSTVTLPPGLTTLGDGLAHVADVTRGASTFTEQFTFPVSTLSLDK